MLATPKKMGLRYFGGKWRLAPWIISHFPAHQCYVEPFAGGLSVLLRKTEAKAEVLRAAKGSVVVSGYESALYEDLYSGWKRVEKVSQCDSHHADIKRTEVLWIREARPAAAP